MRFHIAGESAGSVSPAFDGEALAGYLLKSFAFFRQAGVTEPALQRKLEAFIYEEPLLKRCGITPQRLVVTPDGNVGTCHVLAPWGKHVLGHIDSPTVQENIAGYGKTAGPPAEDKCRDCPAFGICGGPCAAGASIESADTAEPFACRLNTLFIKQMHEELRREEKNG